MFPSQFDIGQVLRKRIGAGGSVNVVGSDWLSARLCNGNERTILVINQPICSHFRIQKSHHRIHIENAKVVVCAVNLIADLPPLCFHTHADIASENIPIQAYESVTIRLFTSVIVVSVLRRKLGRSILHPNGLAKMVAHVTKRTGTELQGCR